MQSQFYLFWSVNYTKNRLHGRNNDLGDNSIGQTKR